MRILHVTTNLKGGAGKATVRLHEALLDQGITSNILCMSLDNRPIKNTHIASYPTNYLIRSLQKLNLIDTIEKKNQLRRKNTQNFFDYFSFSQSSIDITALPIYRNADIINLHWIAEFLDFPSFFIKNKKPVIWSLSDMNSFTGGCHYSNGCNKYLSDCNICPQLKGTINDQNAKINLNLKINNLKKSNTILRIVTPANWLNDCSKSSTLFKDIEHFIIPHASDEKIYQPLNAAYCMEVFNLPKDKIIFLFASDAINNVRKGFSLLHEALSQLNDSNIHMLIIGDKNLEIPLPIGSYSLTGYINDEKLMSIAYNAASAIIIPSIEDNLPLTLIDSMMCGTPSISFDIGGMRDYINNNINGLKSEHFTSSSLADTIQSFMNSIDNFDEKCIRTIAESKFSKTTHAKDYISLYENIL